MIRSQNVLVGLQERVELVPAGRVDEDLDRPELALGRRDRLVDRVAVGHVEVNGERRLVGRAVGDVAGRPHGGRRRQRAHDRAADASRPAGDQGHAGGLSGTRHRHEVLRRPHYDAARGEFRASRVAKRARPDDRQSRRGARARARHEAPGRAGRGRPVGDRGAAVAARRARRPPPARHVLRRGDQHRAVSGRASERSRPAATSSGSTAGATRSGPRCRPPTNATS